MKPFSTLLLFLFTLTACGMDQMAEQGSVAVEEAYQRGYSDFIACERQRNLARMGFKWDPRTCAPPGSTPR